MAKIDLAQVPVRTGSSYPASYAAEMDGRSSLRLGDAGGLTQFGVNIIILQPGGKSSMRHWHLHEEEFVMVIKGDCTLVQDAGPTMLHTGDCASFKAGDPDGHHIINHTGQEARFLVVGTRSRSEVATYSDIDMKVTLTDGVAVYTRKDGTPFGTGAA